MQTLILPFSETDTDILAFINRLRRQKKAFEIKDLEPSLTPATPAERFKEPFFVELKEAIDEIKAIQRGEKPHGQSLSQLLDELDTEYETEQKKLENAH